MRHRLTSLVRQRVLTWPVAAVLACALLLGLPQFAWLAAENQPAELALCGNQGPAPPVAHVVVVMLENLSYKEVIGSKAAPFQTRLARECGNATSNFGATHSSAANYLGISAGEYPQASTPHGCATVKTCADSSDNLYRQLSTAGLTWDAFIEAMPSPCDPASSGDYKIGHNPVIFYTDISPGACRAHDVGEPNLTVQSGILWADLQKETLPSFSWVSPDKLNDGDEGGTAVENERRADSWLRTFIGLMQRSNSYQAGNTLVIVTYDEGTGPDSRTGEDCANKALDLPIHDNTSAYQDSCHVPMFVVYPYTPAGDDDATFFTHYSITKTVEEIFGLPYLAHAGDAGTNSLIGHFGLTVSGYCASDIATTASQQCRGRSSIGTP
jgi:phosphatidylinositol-3-phosphatase